MVKTDKEEYVGIHVWEHCGLGKAPFQFASYEYKTYQATPDSPVQPGGTCAYCGQAICNVCTVKDANGKFFHVGPDCIARIGDKGILKAYKTSKTYREAQRKSRNDLASRKRGEIHKLMEENKDKWANEPHPYGFKDKSYLDYVDWMLTRCGNAGIGRLYKSVETHEKK